MMLGKNDCIGIAPDGITDPVAICRGTPEPVPQDPRPPRPACVIVPDGDKNMDKPGEQPLAGDAAFDSLDGRGWDPQHSRLRQPVLPLLLNMEGGQGVAGGEAGNWLAAHIRALSPMPAARHIIAVPDRLGELGQQRLLDGLRRANISAELLWRPIATVLGWACRLSASDIESLQEKSVLVVHLGFWAPEVSRLELEVQNVNEEGTRWLVPIRSGRGNGLPNGMGWPIEQVAQRLLGVGFDHIELSSVADAGLAWLSRRPWAALCGESSADEIIRDPKGRWRRLHGELLPSDEVAASLREPMQAMLHEQAKLGLPVHRILIDGPLTRMNIGAMTLGDQFGKLLRLWMDSAPAKVEVIPVQFSAVARGAAHYGWRIRHGVPGYYDTVPELSINALKDLRPVFISLLPGQRRVPGGQKLGPVEVSGFAIGAGTQALDYYLTRSDEPTVRLTKTKLPEPPDGTIPVKLVVTQTPCQGFASVEIEPLSPGSLGARKVFLDWNSMTDTGKPPDQILQELSEKIGLAYPDPTPFPCHAAVWAACDVASTIAALIENLRWGLNNVLIMTDADGAAEKCRRSISSKRSLDWLLQNIPGGGDKAGVFDSDGNAPAETSLCASLGSPPLLYSDYRTLIDDLREKCGLAFAKISRSPNRGSDLHRHLLLIAGWLYARVPDEVLEYVRHAVRTGDTIFSRYDFNVAGRCFTQPKDIRLLFARVRRDFEKQPPSPPYDRTKALSLVLAYRADAPLAINLDDAFALVGKTVDVMEMEHQAPARKFFAAAFLLTGLLRCRLQDAGFLDSGKPETQELIKRVQNILDRAIANTAGSLQVQLRGLRKQIPAFLEAQGTDALIFRRLDDLSE